MRRCTALNIVALTAGALILGGFAAPALGQGADEKAYDDRCARCHKVDQVMGYMKAHPEATARAAWLDAKLTRHHARDKAQRAAIIRFLEAEFAKAAK